MAHVSDALRVDRRDHIAILRIEREAKLGALDSGMVDDLHRFVAEVDEDAGIRVLVITGTGRGFIAGADLNEYAGASLAEFDDYQRRSRRTFDAIASCRAVTIAAVNGYALGGGFEVALACDLIVASTAARFGLPEITLGLLPGGGGTQRLSRAIGTRGAKHLILTGRRMSAEEAEQRGLITSVVSPDDLMPTTVELAELLAAQPPVALREGKRVIDAGLQGPLATGLSLEQRTLSTLFCTEDAREGIAAFLSKREPVFHGR